ncbi:uncharacterized protein TNCV_1596731 [Trichonephila clavipes]|nr:uncharacterized protein TNCV_1596731 [Trichonephila clavipes]
MVQKTKTEEWNFCGNLREFIRAPGFEEPLIPYLAKVSLMTWLIVEFSCLVVDHCNWTSGGRFETWILTSRKVFSEESEWKSESSYWLLKSKDNGSGKIAAHLGGCECEWCSDGCPESELEQDSLPPSDSFSESSHNKLAASSGLRLFL